MAKTAEELKPSFESALAELEEIVAQLEAGEKPLEESLALYERGVGALKRCHGILDKSEKRIRLLVKDASGAPALRDVEAVSIAGSELSIEVQVSETSAPKPKPEKSAQGKVDSAGGTRQNLFPSERDQTP